MIEYAHCIHYICLDFAITLRIINFPMSIFDSRRFLLGWETYTVITILYFRIFDLTYWNRFWMRTPKCVCAIFQPPSSLQNSWKIFQPICSLSPLQVGSWEYALFSAVVFSEKLFKSCSRENLFWTPIPNGQGPIRLVL